MGDVVGGEESVWQAPQPRVQKGFGVEIARILRRGTEASPVENRDTQRGQRTSKSNWATSGTSPSTVNEIHPHSALDCHPLASATVPSLPRATRSVPRLACVGPMDYYKS